MDHESLGDFSFEMELEVGFVLEGDTLSDGESLKDPFVLTLLVQHLLKVQKELLVRRVGFKGLVDGPEIP